MPLRKVENAELKALGLIPEEPVASAPPASSPIRFEKGFTEEERKKAAAKRAELLRKRGYPNESN